MKCGNEEEMLKKKVVTSRSGRWSESGEEPTSSFRDGERTPYEVEAGDEHSISLLLQLLFPCLGPHSIGSIETIPSPSSFANGTYVMIPAISLPCIFSGGSENRDHKVVRELYWYRTCGETAGSTVVLQ